MMGTTRTERTSELLHAVEGHFRSIGFFADMLAQAEVGLGELDLDTLEPVAPTSKERLRQTHWRERCVDTPEGGLVLASSGTTGEPSLYKWTSSDLAHVGRATQPLRRALTDSVDALGAVWAPIDRSVMGQCMLAEYLSDGTDAHVLGAVPPDAAYRQLADGGATVLKGLPQHVLGLSTIPGVSQLPLRQVHLGGDVLTENIRNMIEGSLDCECYNFYGLSEVWGPIAAECRCKDGLHVLADEVLVEVVDPISGLRCGPGEIGIALFTTLWEKTSPMLRYRSDDLVQLHEGPCSCGSELPRITHHGRYSGYDYAGTQPLSALLVDAIATRHSRGLVGLRLELRDSPTLAITAAEVDAEALSAELSEYLLAPVTVDLDAPHSAGPKAGGIVDQRGI